MGPKGVAEVVHDGVDLRALVAARKLRLELEPGAGALEPQALGLQLGELGEGLCALRERVGAHAQAIVVVVCAARTQRGELSGARGDPFRHTGSRPPCAARALPPHSGTASRR